MTAPQVSLSRPSVWQDLLTAVQFLTRIPVSNLAYDAESLARSVKFFPLVGLLLGGCGALLHRLLSPHLPRSITALLVVVFLVLITGALHEDGLADVADGFGGGHSKERILVILRDSRIGSYGAAALTLSLLARVLLITMLPVEHVAAYLIAAHTLCRWTTLPLSSFLPPVRAVDGVSGLGARIARLTGPFTLISGTVFALAVCAVLLRTQAVAPILASIAITSFSALYYKSRIGGVTGDCFGATNQLAEISVYLCGAWVAGSPSA